jgi:transcriptional regulator with XRE-family HTH domain
MTGQTCLMTIGQWIKDGREDRGWSQAELGWQAHIDPQRISAWERGLHEPSLKMLTIIAKALGQPLPWDGDTAR